VDSALLADHDVNDLSLYCSITTEKRNK
jgi:hypothetical protein